MKTYQDRVDECESLDQLVTELNAIAEDADAEELKLDEVVDLASLPTFGGRDVKNTSEIFAWDATRILVADNEWTIEGRCKTCGEATFHCKHP